MKPMMILLNGKDCEFVMIIQSFEVWDQCDFIPNSKNTCQDPTTQNHLIIFPFEEVVEDGHAERSCEISFRFTMRC